MQDRSIVYVYGGYPIKEQLSNRGYRWSKADKSWYRELQDTQLEAEKEWLLSMEKSIQSFEIEKANRHHGKKRRYVVIRGNTFGLKDHLKRFGYHANREQDDWVWRKSVPEETSEKEIIMQEKKLLEGFKNITISIE